MTRHTSIASALVRLAWLLPALLLANASIVHAAPPVFDVSACDTSSRTYSIAATTSPSTADAVSGAGADPLYWSATTASGTTACSGSGVPADPWVCSGITVTLPTNPAGPSAKLELSGSATAGTTELTVTVADGTTATANKCTRVLIFEIPGDADGWGDPHLTTVDGVKYDFQSAGEFTALRSDRLELQTRQSAVPTATVPITNAYTGITHCVSIYTAVAVKAGSTRVTIQPSPGEEPNPEAMELRVNGTLTTLGAEPLALKDHDGLVDATLAQLPDGVIELTDAYGTQIVVTPQYWQNRKVWYLNVSVFGTNAKLGTMGRIADKSWLPALPNGNSLGQKPEPIAERYKMLYETFADAWRVTDSNSLFDYAQGTSTATFTIDEWPRNNPPACDIAGQVSAQATSPQAAQQACAVVTDVAKRKNCEFDVMITGNPGFAKSYEIAQRAERRRIGWRATPGLQPTGGSGEACPSVCPKCPDCVCPQSPAVPWWAWVLIALGIVHLLLLLSRLRRS